MLLNSKLSKSFKKKIKPTSESQTIR